MSTSLRIADLLSDGMTALRKAGIDSPAGEARLLLGVAAKLPPAIMIGFPERSVDAAAADAYRTFLARRVDREPVSHILGRREFWSLPFFVSRDVLDPRPDSEALIEAVLDEVFDRQAPLRILDLGVGSGCLLLTLLHELPNAKGWGIDVSPAALAVTERNVAGLQLQQRAVLREGVWGAALTPADPMTFDIIVSNPPYIPTVDIAGLEPEVVRHEPHLALDGGADGLDAYRHLAPVLRQFLSKEGLAALEIGIGQGESVRELMQTANLTYVGSNRDLGNRERCLLFRAP